MRYIADDNHPHGFEIIDAHHLPWCTFLEGLTEEQAKVIAALLNRYDQLAKVVDLVPFKSAELIEALNDVKGYPL